MEVFVPEVLPRVVRDSSSTVILPFLMLILFFSAKQRINEDHFKRLLRSEARGSFAMLGLSFSMELRGGDSAH